ncbi:hypothetical protein [Cryptosporangium aurantiacum]|uniref:SnoaL-like domain-containing protein n=1 Tax=Cryptosporangium aurantiacum TaxID=134849 RepID=A0A1M7RK24_9ACTN|nr:hypothetical protein [Cryptosporangium aurantiacum]SHN46663.1 hypothetical protein SAMN05443668_11746 [Cryptosporangium aurantiacum]
MSDEFRELFERHVGYVVAGDIKAALADMVPERIPAVFEGVTVPGGEVTDARIVDVRRDGETWIGEAVYETPNGPVGLRSIWILHEGAWKANALENFS